VNPRRAQSGLASDIVRINERTSVGILGGLDDAQTSRSRRAETLAEAMRPPSQVSRARSRCANQTKCARARPTAHDRQESAEAVAASIAAVPEADDGGPGSPRATPPGTPREKDSL